MAGDPWTVLGIRPGADARQIRDAWRRSVSEWHPDRNRSPEATVRLQEINDAYASVASGSVEPGWPAFSESVLAGLSGTVSGQAYQPTDTVADDCVEADLEIPLVNWLMNQPVTLGIPLPDNLTTLVTLLHPGRFHHGSVLVFPGSGVSATGTATDLVVTIRVAAPAIEPTRADAAHA